MSTIYVFPNSKNTFMHSLGLEQATIIKPWFIIWKHLNGGLKLPFKDPKNSGKVVNFVSQWHRFHLER